MKEIKTRLKVDNPFGYVVALGLLRMAHKALPSQEPRIILDGEPRLLLKSIGSIRELLTECSEWMKTKSVGAFIEAIPDELCPPKGKDYIQPNLTPYFVRNCFDPEITSMMAIDVIREEKGTEYLSMFFPNGAQRGNFLTRKKRDNKYEASVIGAIPNLLQSDTCGIDAMERDLTSEWEYKDSMHMLYIDPLEDLTSKTNHGATRMFLEGLPFFPIKYTGQVSSNSMQTHCFSRVSIFGDKKWIFCWPISKLPLSFAGVKTMLRLNDPSVPVAQHASHGISGRRYSVVVNMPNTPRKFLQAEPCSAPMKED